MPYQVFGDRVGALALISACILSPIARSVLFIAAIFASTALSPSFLSARSSRIRSFIAPRSSSLNPLNFLFAGMLELLSCNYLFNSPRLSQDVWQQFE